MKKIYYFIIVALISLSKINAAENVNSNCKWSSDNPKQIVQLTSLAVVEDSLNAPEWEKISNSVLLKVTDKRIYLNSLPDRSCKTDLFVVKGDILEQVDFLDDLSWLRVVYKSKRLGKDIVGWIEFSGVCREMGQSRKFNC